jgi:hypothetical protein
MATQEKTYRRLPGRGTNLFQYFRLYEGKDHLLLVISSGYAENYKRFFYRDIQSITLERTPAATVWSGVWVFFFAVLFALTAASTGGAAVGFGIAAGVFLVLLGGNLALGPTCKCHIKTAVQTEHLTNFRRLRTTRKVLLRIEARIHEAQGVLGPAETQEPPQVTSPLESTPDAAPPVATSPPPEEALAPPPPGATQE